MSRRQISRVFLVAATIRGGAIEWTRSGRGDHGCSRFVLNACGYRCRLLIFSAATGWFIAVQGLVKTRCAGDRAAPGRRREESPFPPWPLTMTIYCKPLRAISSGSFLAAVQLESCCRRRFPGWFASKIGPEVITGKKKTRLSCCAACH